MNANKPDSILCRPIIRKTRYGGWQRENVQRLKMNGYISDFFRCSGLTMAIIAGRRAEEKIKIKFKSIKRKGEILYGGKEIIIYILL